MQDRLVLPCGSAGSLSRCRCLCVFIFLGVFTPPWACTCVGSETRWTGFIFVFPFASPCCLASPAAEDNLHYVLSLKYSGPPRHWELKLQTRINLACGSYSRDHFFLFCSGLNSQTVVSCRRERVGGVVVEGNFLLKFSRWAGFGLLSSVFHAL